MTENTFNTEESNANINSPQYYVDDDGSFKFISPVISSSNFDGSVPVFEGSASVSDLISGMYLQINGTDFSPIVNISKDDPGLEDSATTDVSITYLDNQNEVQTAVYNSSDIVTVRYENWDEKYLGTQGWLLTYGGNAIFSNVGVRGDLEATTLDVGGSDGITYDGNTVTIGASVVINAPVTFNGSGSYVTYDYLSASYADLSELATSGTTIINGGNITTGTISGRLLQTPGYSGVTNGSTFSSAGTMAINLSNGTITAPAFRINTAGAAVFGGTLSAPGGTIGGFTIGGTSLTSGVSPNIVGITTGTNAFFANSSTTTGPGSSFNVTNTGVLTAVNANLSGVITASGGVFGPASNPINLVNQGTNSILDMGTIKMVANVTSGNRYGSLRFYETNGTTAVGELNTAITNKTWYSYVGNQNGIVVGTTSDFYYVPTSSPTRRGRYQGNGFEVVSQDGTNLFSVGGGSGDVTIGTSTNSKATNIYGVTTILGGSRLEVSNGNFRLINSSNSYIPFVVNNGSSAGGTTANVTARAIYDYTTTSTANIFIDGSATLRRFQSSTEKIKKDIEPISASFSILEVEVVQFKYKEETLPEEDERFNKIVPGFIAEQVYQVLPIAVDLNEGEPENWNDRYLIPVMVKTIQDQQKTIEELTNKLYNIEQRLESAGI